MKFTVRTKLITYSMFLVTVIMIGVVYFSTIREVSSKRASVENQMERIARNIATIQLVENQSWSDYQDYISRLMAVNNDIVYIAIYDERNWLRAHTLNPDLVEIGPKAPLSEREQSKIVRSLDEGSIAEESQDDLITQKVNILVGNRVLGNVHVGFSIIKINNEFREKIIRNIWVGLFYIVIMSIISYFLSRRLTRPLEKLSAAMTSLAGGNLKEKVNIKNRDEIGQLAQNFNEMVERLRERDIIEKLGQEMSKTFRLQHLSSLVRDRLKGAIGANSAKIYLAMKEEAGVFCETVSENGGANSDNSIKCDDKTNSYLLKETDGFVLETAPQNVRHAFDRVLAGMKDLVVPMVIKNKLLGLLVFGLENKASRFSDKQCHFAAILAGQAAFALDNALLYDELREQERIKRELEIAREVQHKLLPLKMPEIEGFEFDGICLPALEVGGDYFDFFSLDKERLGIVIADVSGKGTSASFYMAEMKGMMTSLTAVYQSPKKLLTELNRRLYTSLERKVFATMIYGVLNVKSRKLTFGRAGHNSLLQITANGHCHAFEPDGIGLGLDSGEAFEVTLVEKTLTLNKGDAVLLYTDGLTESMNQKREMFGEERLLNIICNNGSSSPVELRKQIFKEVESFSDGAKQHDDLTMVVLRSST